MWRSAFGAGLSCTKSASRLRPFGPSIPDAFSATTDLRAAGRNSSISVLCGAKRRGARLLSPSWDSSSFLCRQEPGIIAGTFKMIGFSVFRFLFFLLSCIQAWTRGRRRASRMCTIPNFIAFDLVIDFVRVAHDRKLVDAGHVGCWCDGAGKICEQRDPPLNHAFNRLRLPRAHVRPRYRKDAVEGPPALEGCIGPSCVVRLDPHAAYKNAAISLSLTNSPRRGLVLALLNRGPRLFIELKPARSGREATESSISAASSWSGLRQLTDLS